MPLFIISVLVQVAFVIHVVKTGRNTTWIWIIIMLPMAGAIAYLVLEVLPDLGNSRAGRSAGKKVREAMDSNRDINAAANNFSKSDTVENSMRLAAECHNKGLYAEAKELYQRCLKGPHADDPHILFGLARACYEVGEFTRVKSVLDELIEKNPDFKDPDAHLLYARALEAMGEADAAGHEYETLHGYYPGPDASFHYGKFLKSQGKVLKSRDVFDGILAKAERADKRYRSSHSEILRQVMAELHN